MAEVQTRMKAFIPNDKELGKNSKIILKEAAKVNSLDKDRKVEQKRDMDNGR